jgi:two-component system, response regulator
MLFRRRARFPAASRSASWIAVGRAQQNMASLRPLTAPHGGRILVVEDNASDLELTLRALRESGFSEGVGVARDGTQALDFILCRGEFAGRCTDEQPDLVLLDLKLPFIDGMEVLRRIRAESPTRFVPVVVLSSSGQERDVSQSYQLGVNSYIVKPLAYDKFVEAIRLVATYWLALNRPPSNDWQARRSGAGNDRPASAYSSSRSRS